MNAMTEDRRASSSVQLVADPSVISPRQRQVLRLAALGMSYGEIAIELGVTLSTVRNHLTVAYRRLHGHCLADALRAVGWLRVPTR